MIVLIVNSILLGLGLAMDAFSVSLANGLSQPHMKGSRMTLIAGVFAVFQAVMPMIGWALVHTLAEAFKVFYNFIPFIAFILLAFIGGKMILDGTSPKKDKNALDLTGKMLFLMGIATSIDALSVGFTIPDYSLTDATITSLIIGLITFILCMLALLFGKKLKGILRDKATVLGGCVLLAIALKSLISRVIAFL